MTAYVLDYKGTTKTIKEDKKRVYQNSYKSIVEIVLVVSSIEQNNFVALFRFSDLTLKLFERRPRIFSFFYRESIK